MIVNEISLVIQKIFSVKQPKDQRFPEDIINGCFIIFYILFFIILFYFQWIIPQCSSSFLDILFSLKLFSVSHSLIP